MCARSVLARLLVLGFDTFNFFRLILRSCFSGFHSAQSRFVSVWLCACCCPCMRMGFFVAPRLFDYLVDFLVTVWLYGAQCIWRSVLVLEYFGHVWQFASVSNTKRDENAHTKSPCRVRSICVSGLVSTISNKYKVYFGENWLWLQFCKVLAALIQFDLKYTVKCSVCVSFLVCMHLGISILNAAT